MLRAKEHTPTPYPYAVFTFGLEIKSIKVFGGVLDLHKENKENFIMNVIWAIGNFIIHEERL